MENISLKPQRKRKVPKASTEQVNNALGTTTVSLRVTPPPPPIEDEVLTSISPSSGSTPPLVYDLMGVHPFAKVSSRDPKPFQAIFYGTDGAQIIETIAESTTRA